MKNIFKKTFWMLVPAGMLLTTASCTDFLDKRPENSIDTETVDYTNLANMYMPVSGVYSKVRTEGSHWMAHALTIVRDPDVWSGRTDDQAPLVDFGNFTYDRSFWGFNEVFRVYYQIIMNANTALQGLNKYAANITDPTDMATYNKYCGEVRYLRAYATFRLMQNFGDVPLLENNLQTYIPLRKKASVEKYLLDELQFCSNVLPAIGPYEQTDHPGAVTKYSALHLKAKVHLEKGEWDKAELCADSVITSGKFELYGDFYELFKINAKLSKESLFEIQSTDFGNPAGGEWVGFNCFYDYQNCGITNIADPTRSYGGWTFNAVHQTAIDWAESRGETVRAITTFLKPDTDTPSGDRVGSANPYRVFFGKYYTPTAQMGGIVAAGANNNIRVFRYADVLLIAAEAKVRQGKSGDSEYNLVRTRAKMDTKTGVTLNDILDERRMEFMSEWGEYYFDIIRTGRESTNLPNTFSKDKTFYPIPLEQIDLNELLGQPAVD